MPITDFDGKTFVAFLDISGFKQLMEDGEKAWRAINKLYQYGYDVISRNNQQNDIRIEGLFVSDCGVLFVRDCHRNRVVECLKFLLKAIKEINRRMLEHKFMLKTSIAYGDFRYKQRIEIEGVGKNPIYGNAYVSAFLDNENVKPEIQPGQCRIVINEDLPQDVLQSIENNNGILSTVRRRKGDDNHLYFYWMVEEPSAIEMFEKEYSDAYNLKYAGMLEALKKAVRRGHRQQQRGD